MGSVSPKMDGTPIDVPSVDEDEEDMTSVMSAEQRKALQNAAKTEKEASTLERETAKPPPSDARPVTIPRAAGVPAEARAEAAPRVEVPAKTEAAKTEPPKSEPAKTEAAAATPARGSEAKPGFATWEIVAFVLLAAAIVTALRI